MLGRRGSRRAGVLALGAVLSVILGGCVPPPVPMPGRWDAMPAAATVDPVREYAEARLATMTLAEKVSSMFMIHVAGTDASAIRSTVASTGAGGIIDMGDNVPGPASGLARINSTLSPDPGLPLLIAIDQEGGIVRRLPGDEFPAAMQLRDLPASAAKAAFAKRAAIVASADVSINFGIIADVTGNPASFIYSRVLGADAGAASPRVAAAVEGEKGVVLSTLKHFPGHGSVEGDSHTSIPATAMSKSTWQKTQAPPFEAGIAAGAEVVMMGHLRFAAVDSAPATLSAEWHRILREELGFDGLIVTDDMSMLEHSRVPKYASQTRNAVAAVEAGNDLLLYVGPVDVRAAREAIVAAVEAGDIPQQTIDDAALRLLIARRTLSGETGPFVSCAASCQTLVG